ncbi:MAG: glycosyltransferase [Planctomycetota bacterium]|nr:MAG: glycosyltransferase [Planctomycetota bacterium]
MGERVSEVAELLAELTRRGVTLEPRGDSLAFHPRAKVTGELRERLQQHKGQILGLLRGEVGLSTPSVAPTTSVPTAIDYSVVVMEPRTETFESALLSLFAQPLAPREILVCGPISKAIRKTIRTYAGRHVREAASPTEARQEQIVLLDGRTLLGRDWIVSAVGSLRDGVGAVYCDHELLTTGGRTNYPEQVTGDDLARSGFEANTVIVRRSVLIEAWQPGDGIADCLRRLSRRGWNLRKHAVPVLYRGGSEPTYFDRQRLAHETVALFIPLAGRESLWRELRKFLDRQTWPHDRLRLILCDTSQDEQFSRLVRDWISRCDYPDVRHLRFAPGTKGLADMPRDQQIVAVNEAMCRIYNQLRQNLTSDYVWVLEDDIIPPDDVLAQLLWSFDEHTASVCAPYRSRFDGWYLVWSRERLGDNGVHQLTKPLPDSQQVQQIRGSGFGCVVFRAEVLREHIFHLPTGEHWYDVRFFRELLGRWKRKVDWSCECQHLHNTPRPASKITKRNLLYHVTPFASNDIWLRNTQQMVKRIDLFNGRRIIAVATGDGLVPPDEVRATFGSHDVEIVPHPNSRELRENATFLKLLEQVDSTDPEEATFYAHAKGVAKDILCSGDPLGSRYWRNAMYHELLDGWDRIAELLEEYPVVGSHRRHHPQHPTIYPDGQSSSDWHFGGTFFWFRNRDVFATNRWREVWQPTGWGAEAWVGRMFPFDQSACVAYDGLEDAYNPDSYFPQIDDEVTADGCHTNDDPVSARLVQDGTDHRTEPRRARRLRSQRQTADRRQLADADGPCPGTRGA